MADPTQTTSDLPRPPGPNIIDRINEACVGHPFARIPWPHRLLHDARDEIERLLTALEYVERQFAAETWVCPRCAYSDPTDGCDSHLYVKEVLGK